MDSATHYASQDLDHLGIVAGVCNLIGLIERVDAIVGETDRKVSVGEAVQAMVLNGLGFTGRPLYLTPEFFANKPVDILIGEDLTAEDLNEHSLGRALDRLYEVGVTKVFAYVAAAGIQVADEPLDVVHLDASSFSFQGDYDTPPDMDGEAITITHGYSRDRRPDLKQAMVALICSHQGALPVWFEALDGNQADSSAFPEIVSAYIEQLDAEEEMPYFIADSALYTQETIQELGAEVPWITRVPASIGAVKDLYHTVSPEMMEPLQDGSYRIQEVCSIYGGVRQRWLLVYSENRYQRDRNRLQERITDEREEAAKQLRRLKRREYQSREAAKAALETVAQDWKFHTAEVFEFVRHGRYDRPGRPAKGQEPDYYVWQPVGKLIEDDDAVQAALRLKGKFVLATNDLDTEHLPPEALLTHYTAQTTTVERGFRFLKDPLFFAHSLFLKKPERVMTLLMVMGLCLLIYALAEHLLRTELRHRNETLPDQKGNPTQRITMRRVFQIFEGIHVLIIYAPTGPPTIQQRLILNLTDLHERILDLLGPEPKKCYSSPG